MSDAAVPPDTATAGELSQLRRLPVPEGLDGERVDVGLARLLGLSRSKAADLAGSGLVRWEQVPLGKSDRLLAGALLEVELPADPPAAAPALVAGLRVVHEDDDLVVVDKPVGVAAHPSPGWSGPTVVGGLAAAGVRISTSGAAERQGVVHRLDVGTSGLMAVAKSEVAYSHLKRQFRERTVGKTYLALVQGYPDPTAGTVDAPIGRHPTQSHRWAVVAGGKPSISHYETVETFRAATLLRVTLETGRTHQIRVHLSALRHPCVGDLTYGADPTLAERLGLARQWLHAAELQLDHPTSGERLTLEASLPADLQQALDRLAEG